MNSSWSHAVERGLDGHRHGLVELDEDREEGVRTEAPVLA
jgi:hypothetical protein